MAHAEDLRRKKSAAKSPWKGNLVGGAGFTVGAENTDVIAVTVQLRGQTLADRAARSALFWYLSDDAHGDSVVATAASGGVAAGTDGLVHSFTAGKAGLCVGEADGDLDFAITHSGVKTCYLVLVLPDSSLAVSGAITFA